MADAPKTTLPPLAAASAAPGVGGSPVAPVAAKPVGSPPATVPPGTVLPKPTPPIGSPGYQFKHLVDTPAGQEERREHERLRKATKRDAAKAVAASMAEPAPLPSATTPRAGNAAPPGGAVIPVAFGAEAPPTDEPPPVPWQPELLTDLVGELLRAAEQGRVAQYLARCEEAGLTGKLVAEIEADAHFPKMAVVLLKRSLPRLACRLLNKAGVSAEHEDLLCTVTALLLMFQHDRKVSARLDKIVETAELAKQAAAKVHAGRAGGSTGAYTAASAGSTPAPATNRKAA